MHFISCEHPKLLRNKQTGEYVSVPCGKCDVCLGKRAAGWIERLTAESTCHAFTLFVTLTYDDAHVPTLRCTSDHRMWFDSDGVGLDLKDFDFDNWSVKEQSFVKNSPYIYYLRSLDISDFMKRLRRYIDYYINDENKKIRFFACGEYGETLLRPHWHLLLFFDSKEIAQNIDTLLYKAWSLDNISFGDIKSEFVENSAISYVAKYVNCTSHLPKIFQLRSLAPRSVCSKNPFIGALSISTKTLQEMVNTSSPVQDCIRKKSDGSKQFVSCPLWRSLENFLYPRFTGFSRAIDSLRTDVYRLYEPFLNYCINRSIPDSLSTFSSWLLQHYDKPFRTSVFDFIFRLYDVDTRFLTDEVVINSHVTSSIYYAIKRVYTNSCKFSMSNVTYIKHLLDYYHNKDANSLKTQLIFMEEYFSHNTGVSSCIDFDGAFVSNVHKLPYNDARLKYGLIVESFGIDFDEFWNCPDSLPSIFDLLDTKDYISLSHTIAKKSRKTKRKNAYVARRRFKNTEYYRNIDNYYNQVS